MSDLFLTKCQNTRAGRCLILTIGFTYSFIGHNKKCMFLRILCLVLKKENVNAFFKEEVFIQLSFIFFITALMLTQDKFDS